MAEHAGGRPALPVAAPHHTLALREAPRHREDERHGHVGGILGEHTRRVGDRGAALARRLKVDVVYASAEGGDGRKSVGSGKSGLVRVDLGDSWVFKKKKKQK